MRQGSHTISFLWNLVPLNSCQQTFLNILNPSKSFFVFNFARENHIYNLHDNPNLFPRFLAFPIFWRLLLLPLCHELFFFFCGVDFDALFLGETEIKVKNLACKNYKILRNNYITILCTYGPSTHAKFQINP